jgi:hypothetical protein
VGFESAVVILYMSEIVSFALPLTSPLLRSVD